MVDLLTRTLWGNFLLIHDPYLSLQFFVGRMKKIIEGFKNFKNVTFFWSSRIFFRLELVYFKMFEQDVNGFRLDFSTE